MQADFLIFIEKFSIISNIFDDGSSQQKNFCKQALPKTEETDFGYVLPDGDGNFADHLTVDKILYAPDRVTHLKRGCCLLIDLDLLFNLGKRTLGENGAEGGYVGA